jgi:hypothetical protein
VQEGVVLLLPRRPRTVLEVPEGVLDDVLRTVEGDLRDQLLEERLDLALEVLT